MKKVLLAILCVLSVFCLTLNVEAKKTTKKKTTTTVKENLPKIVEGKEKVTVYVFHKDGCPYCQKALTYIKDLKGKYGDYFELVDYEVYDANWNIEDQKLYKLMNNVAEEFNKTVDGVPYIVIGKTYDMNGFDENSTGDEIKTAILEAYTDENYVDIVAQYKNIIDNEPDEHSKDGLVILGILLATAGVIAAIVICSRKNN